MKCPKCKDELRTLSQHDVQVDQCPACNGLWFDAFEHEQLKALQGAEAIDSGAPSALASTAAGGGLCPRCSVKMIDMVVAGQPHIAYESCGLCHGVFFDAGEFRDFSDETFGERLRATFNLARKAS